MNWRKLNYTSADGKKLSMDFESKSDYKSDVIEAKGFCKVHGYHFIRLGKSLLNTFGEKVK